MDVTTKIVWLLDKMRKVFYRKMNGSWGNAMSSNDELHLQEVSQVIKVIPQYQSKCKFNIFWILEVEDKEVIMCRYLADLFYPNGKIKESNSYEDVPNLKFMNECAINIVDKEYREKYVENALNAFETMWLCKLK